MLDYTTKTRHQTRRDTQSIHIIRLYRSNHYKLLFVSYTVRDACVDVSVQQR